MKKMNQKQWVGVVLAVVGLIALILSHTIKGEVGEEMGKVRSFTSPLSSHGGDSGRIIGGAIDRHAGGEAAGYLQGANLLLIGGIVLIIVGGYLFIMNRKKK